MILTDDEKDNVKQLIQTYESKNITLALDILAAYDYSTYGISKLFGFDHVDTPVHQDFQIGKYLFFYYFDYEVTPHADIGVKIPGISLLHNKMMVFINGINVDNNRYSDVEQDKYSIKQIYLWKLHFLKYTIEYYYRDNSIKYQSFPSKKQQNDTNRRRKG
ncbi:hypothetical protein [Winogradskyella sp.]|uniref:hypothetical protein n=1 Tax=Winogradskyella sp. TaxID=1883156 RepID=UPI00262DE5F2|nr:hypothetical protein [Winogradskyella sp.]